MIKLFEGDKAPNFVGEIQNGNKVTLDDYSGKKLVLYFYPKDNTPCCTNQACNISENIDNYKNNGFEVLGVSPDSIKSHIKFIEKYNLAFNLISDETKNICNLYGVWGPKKFMGKEYEGIHRKSFLIDEDGKIIHIFEKVKTKTHGQDVLTVLNAL